MNRRFRLAVATLLFGFLGVAQGGGEQSKPEPFSTASIYFEQNATDQDVEVVFDVGGGDEGLAKLSIVSPDNRTVIDFTAPDASAMGLRTFHLESPEPQDVEGLKSAYPEGVYKFTGVTASGQQLYGESTLHHKLPTPVAFLQPKAGADVSIDNLKITWTPVKNLAAYIVELEQDELGMKIKAQLPASASGFAVPADWLVPGTEYQLSIATVTDDGNLSFVETRFSTAGKK